MEKEVTREPKTVRQPPAGTEPDGAEASADGKPCGVRHASDEQFKKAHRKTRTLHAGLFGRLAE